LVPKPLRRDSERAEKKRKVKQWNPATFFIISLLLIGSMSIQMISLRNEFSSFNRRADVRIGLLKEIVEKIQKGEEVDVEGLLGTGNLEKEQEWAEGELYLLWRIVKTNTVPTLTLDGSHEGN
jgi:hypothetical protein